MVFVGVDDLKIARKVVQSQMEAVQINLNMLEYDIAELSKRLYRMTQYENDLNIAIFGAQQQEEKSLRDLKKMTSIGEAAVYLAKMSPDQTISSQFAKKMIADCAGLGTAGAIHAYFSRAENFQSVDRGTYKLIDGAKIDDVNSVRSRPAPSPPSRTRSVSVRRIKSSVKFK